MYLSIVPLKLGVDIQSQTKVKSRETKNIQHGHLAAILKLTLLKINSLLHIYISIVPLKFGVDIQSETKVRVWKPKNPKWPPGGHFEWRHWKSIGFCLWPPSTRIWSLKLKFQSKLDLQSGNHATYRVRKRKIQHGRQAAILKMTLLKINRLLPIYISIVPLKFEVDIQSQSQVRVWKPKNPIWPPFWKWRRWKSIGFCLWPPSTCIWNLKLKFQSKLDLCSGNHVVYRQTDGRTRWIQYTPPPTSLGGGIIMAVVILIHNR